MRATTTPRVRRLRNWSAELESGAGAIACASGMAGIHMAVLAALMDRPKRVVAANMMYGATTSMLMNIFGPMGVETAQVDPCDLPAFEATLNEEKTGAVVVETIANPLLRVPPLDKIAAMCRARGRTAHRRQHLRYATAGAASGARREYRLSQRQQVSGGPRRRFGRRDRGR